MKSKAILLLVIGLASFSYSFAQNVGIGTNSPQDKLHVDGYLRSNALISTSDTLVTLASPNGRIITASAGNSGQVLTSNGTGRAPSWEAPGSSSGKIHYALQSSYRSLTVNTSSAPSALILSKTFTPQNDTVIVNFNVSGWVVASSMPTTPGHPFLFRVIVNGSTQKQISAAPHRNTSSFADRGRLTLSYSYPVAVNAGVQNTVDIRVQTLFTPSGSITIELDPTTLSNNSNLIIYDFATN